MRPTEISQSELKVRNLSPGGLVEDLDPDDELLLTEAKQFLLDVELTLGHPSFGFGLGDPGSSFLGGLAR
jgi:hypothetical protein